MRKGEWLVVGAIFLLVGMLAACVFAIRDRIEYRAAVRASGGAR